MRTTWWKNRRMSGRNSMWRMVDDEDEEGILRMLDEGVDPAAPEECDEEVSE
jgi:hypothetical protein